MFLTISIMIFFLFGRKSFFILRLSLESSLGRLNQQLSRVMIIVFPLYLISGCPMHNLFLFSAQSAGIQGYKIFFVTQLDHRSSRKIRNCVGKNTRNLFRVNFFCLLELGLEICPDYSNIHYLLAYLPFHCKPFGVF